MRRLGEPEPVLLTTLQASRMLGISRQTIAAMCASGELRAVRLGPKGRWRVIRAGVEALVRAEPVQSESDALVGGPTTNGGG